MNPPGPSDMSDSSDQSDRSDDLHRLIPKHGGYEKLRGYHAAQTAYDATQVFCDRFIEKRSRTHDQMVQAARSGARNISEGSVASGTSENTGLQRHTPGLARGSYFAITISIVSSRLCGASSSLSTGGVAVGVSSEAVG